MRRLSLQEIKQIEFEILKKFKDVCDENCLKFYLSNGTLLGAIKYKGFIPWDDDIDVFMPRVDYERLMQIFHDDDRYQLFSLERNLFYRFPFAKLCDMTTVKIETNIDNGITMGLCIDIFPLDVWNSDIKKARRELRKIQKNMFCLNLSKLRKADSHNPLKRILKMVMIRGCKVCGSKYFIKKIFALASVQKKNHAFYKGCKVWPIYGEREIIPEQVFFDTIDVEFEGIKFPAPIGYDIYLHSLYGDYKMDLPIEKQESHHSFKAFKV